MITGDRRCAACGYFEEFHDLGTLKCPRETADVNGRRGTFREYVPERRFDWFGLSVPYSKKQLDAMADAERLAEDVVTGPPQVPARPPLCPGEIAGGKRNAAAIKLGRLAIAAHWTVAPLYWRAADGREGCGVWLSRGDLRALATWKRAAGNVGALTGWEGDRAYAWRTSGTQPVTRINLTQLEGLIS